MVSTTGIGTPRTLAKEIAELRPLPTIAVKILELTSCEESSAQDLADVLAADQALSTKVLRLANSVYFGVTREIATVRDAVVLLGMTEIRSAAFVSCIIDAVPASTNLVYRTFWRFSVAVGLLAEVLARAESKGREEAYTAGVLHNIGLLALDQHRPELLKAAKELAEAEQITVSEALDRQVRFTDAELGGALARCWNLPEPLAEAAANHLTPVSELENRSSLAGFVVRARDFVYSNGLADGIGQPRAVEPSDHWEEPPIAAAFKRAGGFDGVIARVDGFIASAVRD